MRCPEQPAEATMLRQRSANRALHFLQFWWSVGALAVITIQLLDWSGGAHNWLGLGATISAWAAVLQSNRISYRAGWIDGSPSLPLPRAKR